MRKVLGYFVMGMFAGFVGLFVVVWVIALLISLYCPAKQWFGIATTYCT